MTDARIPTLSELLEAADAKAAALDWCDDYEAARNALVASVEDGTYLLTLSLIAYYWQDDAEAVLPPGAFALLPAATGRLILRYAGERLEIWQTRGTVDNPHGPAIRVVTDEGDVLREEWHRRGMRHRVGGPATTRKFRTGYVIKTWEQWGLRHRLDGPALQRLFPDGGLKQEWWEHGRLVQIEDTRDS